MEVEYSSVSNVAGTHIKSFGSEGERSERTREDKIPVLGDMDKVL